MGSVDFSADVVAPGHGETGSAGQGFANNFVVGQIFPAHALLLAAAEHVRVAIAAVTWMADPKGGQQLHHMGGIGLRRTADAEAIAGFDVASHQVDPVEAGAAAGAQVLQGSVGVQLEVARLGVNAGVVIRHAFEIEVGQQQRGLHLDAGEPLLFQPVLQQLAQGGYTGGPGSTEHAAKQMNHRGFTAAGRGLDVAQHLLPLTDLRLLVEADPTHHGRSDGRAAAKAHFQIGALLFWRE